MKYKRILKSLAELSVDSTGRVSAESAEEATAPRKSPRLADTEQIHGVRGFRDSELTNEATRPRGLFSA